MNLTVDRTQEEFDVYIKTIPPTDTCKYMEDIHGIITVCNYPFFSCTYRSKDLYSRKSGNKHECTREKYMKLHRLFNRGKR